MLFGWADNQAASGNASWAGRWGLYRQNGGYGADAVAPQYWDTGVKNMNQGWGGNSNGWVSASLYPKILLSSVSGASTANSRIGSKWEGERFTLSSCVCECFRSICAGIHISLDKTIKLGKLRVTILTNTTPEFPRADAPRLHRMENQPFVQQPGSRGVFDPQDYPGLMTLLLELVTNYLVEL